MKCGAVVQRCVRCHDDATAHVTQVTGPVTTAVEPSPLIGQAAWKSWRSM